MKIIKEGEHPDNEIFKGSCYNCGLVAEAEKQELQMEYDQRENGSFGRADCPCCRHEIIFYPKNNK